MNAETFTYTDPATTALATAPATGLRVRILRPAANGNDATNGGVTRDHDDFILLGEDVRGPFEPDATTPALVFVERYLGGKPAHYAIPARTTDPRWNDNDRFTTPMFGGNFVWSSDSRFPTSGPLPVHDRFETWAEYDRMTR